jgi:ubiquitin-protein ligase
MITGPSRTPYEDGLFFFDFQLSSDYPQVSTNRMAINKFRI